MVNIESLIVFTLGGSVFWFLVSLVVFIALTVLAEINEQGWVATFSLIAFLSVNYGWGDFKVLDYIVWWHVVLYLVLGFIFSVIRTYFKGGELNKEYFNLEPTDYRRKDNTIEQYKEKYFDLKEHVFRWWFLFPVCFLNWVFGKILKDAWHKAYDKMSYMYERLLHM